MKGQSKDGEVGCEVPLNGSEGGELTWNESEEKEECGQELKGKGHVEEHL